MICHLALQWLVLTFEPHFIAVSLQENKSTLHQRGGSRYVKGSLIPNKYFVRVFTKLICNYRERNRMYSGSTIDTGRDALDISAPSSPAERIKRVSSSSSIASLGSSCSLQGLPTIGIIYFYE